MTAGTVLTSLIAVGGTLAGSGFTSWWHARTTRAERRDQRAAHRRDEKLTAVADLVTALDAHRAAMWVRETNRLSGKAAEVTATGRRAHHETRAAVSGPLARVRILAPGLADAAATATHATYALRNADDLPDLDGKRRASLDAVAALEADAAALLKETS